MPFPNVADKLHTLTTTQGSELIQARVLSHSSAFLAPTCPFDLSMYVHALRDVDRSFPEKCFSAPHSEFRLPHSQFPLARSLSLAERLPATTHTSRAKIAKKRSSLDLFPLDVLLASFARGMLLRSTLRVPTSALAVPRSIS